VSQFNPSTTFHGNHRCQAINAVQMRHQQPWKKCCEQGASHFVRGVHLCGSHFNAAVRGDLKIVVNFEKLDPETLT
jgi:hypothetical protein